MRELSGNEQKILIDYLNKGFRWVAFNENHTRFFECDEKPFLRGGMYRVIDGETTILGESVSGPGLFDDIGYGLIELSTITEQLSLF